MVAAAHQTNSRVSSLCVYVCVSVSVYECVFQRSHTLVTIFVYCFVEFSKSSSGKHPLEVKLVNTALPNPPCPCHHIVHLWFLRSIIHLHAVKMILLETPELLIPLAHTLRTHRYTHIQTENTHTTTGSCSQSQLTLQEWAGSLKHQQPITDKHLNLRHLFTPGGNRRTWRKPPPRSQENIMMD